MKTTHFQFKYAEHNYNSQTNKVRCGEHPSQVLIANRLSVETGQVSAKEEEEGQKEWRAMRQQKKKNRNVVMRVGILNIGAMNGRGRKLADMIERRKVDVLCVQETRWKGRKARNIRAGYKLFYHGTDEKRNGEGIVLKEDCIKSVLEGKRQEAGGRWYCRENGQRRCSLGWVRAFLVSGRKWCKVSPRKRES